MELGPTCVLDKPPKHLSALGGFWGLHTKARWGLEPGKVRVCACARVRAGESHCVSSWPCAHLAPHCLLPGAFDLLPEAVHAGWGEPRPGIPPRTRRCDLPLQDACCPRSPELKGSQPGLKPRLWGQENVGRGGANTAAKIHVAEDRSSETSQGTGDGDGRRPPGLCGDYSCERGTTSPSHTHICTHTCTGTSSLRCPLPSTPGDPNILCLPLGWQVSAMLPSTPHQGGRATVSRHSRAPASRHQAEARILPRPHPEARSS